MKRRAFVVLVLATSLSLPVLSLPARAASLPDRVVVAKEGDEDAAFAQTQDALGEAGVSAAVARRALEGLDRYIHKRVEREKKTVTIYPEVIVEVTKAAALKGWSANDISAILVHVQAHIDSGHHSAEDARRVTVAEIMKGKARRDVMATMETMPGGH